MPAAAAAGCSLWCCHTDLSCKRCTYQTAAGWTYSSQCIVRWLGLAGKGCNTQHVLSVYIGSNGGYVGDVVDDDDATWCAC
jgi:hypothetical protein